MNDYDNNETDCFEGREHFNKKRLPNQKWQIALPFSPHKTLPEPTRRIPHLPLQRRSLITRTRAAKLRRGRPRSWGFPQSSPRWKSGPRPLSSPGLYESACDIGEVRPEENLLSVHVGQHKRVFSCHKHRVKLTALREDILGMRRLQQREGAGVKWSRLQQQG